MAENRPASVASSVPMLVPMGKHAGNPPLPLKRLATVIGSVKTCHLHLQSSQVSQHHAVIITDGGGAVVRDLASRTHTYVNEKPVREHVLGDGDVIRVGRFALRYSAAKFRPRPVDPPPAAAVVVGGSPPVPVKGRVTLIGRRVSCDLALLAESVSTCHAILFEADGKRYLRDLNSRTGTRVNGEKIHQIEIKFGAPVHIGESDLMLAAAEARPAVPPAREAAAEPVPIDLEAGLPVEADVAAEAGAPAAAEGRTGTDAPIPLDEPIAIDELIPLDLDVAPATAVPAGPIPLDEPAADAGPIDLDDLLPVEPAAAAAPEALVSPDALPAHDAAGPSAAVPSPRATDAPRVGDEPRAADSDDIDFADAAPAEAPAAEAVAPPAARPSPPAMRPAPRPQPVAAAPQPPAPAAEPAAPAPAGIEPEATDVAAEALQEAEAAGDGAADEDGAPADSPAGRRGWRALFSRGKPASAADGGEPATGEVAGEAGESDAISTTGPIPAPGLAAAGADDADADDAIPVVGSATTSAGAAATVSGEPTVVPPAAAPAPVSTPTPDEATPVAATPATGVSGGGVAVVPTPSARADVGGAPAAASSGDALQGRDVAESFQRAFVGDEEPTPADAPTAGPAAGGAAGTTAAPPPADLGATTSPGAATPVTDEPTSKGEPTPTDVPAAAPAVGGLLAVAEAQVERAAAAASDEVRAAHLIGTALAPAGVEGLEFSDVALTPPAAAEAPAVSGETLVGEAANLPGGADTFSSEPIVPGSPATTLAADADAAGDVGLDAVEVQEPVETAEVFESSVDAGAAARPAGPFRTDDVPVDAAEADRETAPSPDVARPADAGDAMDAGEPAPAAGAGRMGLQVRPEDFALAVPAGSTPAEVLPPGTPADEDADVLAFAPDAPAATSAVPAAAQTLSVIESDENARPDAPAGGETTAAPATAAALAAGPAVDAAAHAADVPGAAAEDELVPAGVERLGDPAPAATSAVPTAGEATPAPASEAPELTAPVSAALPEASVPAAAELPGGDAASSPADANTSIHADGSDHTDDAFDEIVGQAVEEARAEGVDASAAPAAEEISDVSGPRGEVATAAGQADGAAAPLAPATAVTVTPPSDAPSAATVSPAATAGADDLTVSAVLPAVALGAAGAALELVGGPSSAGAAGAAAAPAAVDAAALGMSAARAAGELAAEALSAAGDAAARITGNAPAVMQVPADALPASAAPLREPVLENDASPVTAPPSGAAPAADGGAAADAGGAVRDVGGAMLGVPPGSVTTSAADAIDVQARAPMADAELEDRLFGDGGAEAAARPGDDGGPGGAVGLGGAALLPAFDDAPAAPLEATITIAPAADVSVTAVAPPGANASDASAATVSDATGAPPPPDVAGAGPAAVESVGFVGAAPAAGETIEALPPMLGAAASAEASAAMAEVAPPPSPQPGPAAPPEPEVAAGGGGGFDPFAGSGVNLAHFLGGLPLMLSEPPAAAGGGPALGESLTGLGGAKSFLPTGGPASSATADRGAVAEASPTTTTTGTPVRPAGTPALPPGGRALPPGTEPMGDFAVGETPAGAAPRAVPVVPPPRPAPPRGRRAGAPPGTPAARGPFATSDPFDLSPDDLNVADMGDAIPPFDGGASGAAMAAAFEGLASRPPATAKDVFSGIETVAVNDAAFGGRSTRRSDDHVLPATDDVIARQAEVRDVDFADNDWWDQTDDEDGGLFPDALAPRPGGADAEDLHAGLVGPETAAAAATAAGDAVADAPETDPAAAPRAGRAPVAPPSRPAPPPLAARAALVPDLSGDERRALEGPPPAAPRRGRYAVPLLLLTMVGAMGAASAGIWYGLPPRGRVDGVMRFKNLQWVKNTADARQFEASQRSLLGSARTLDLARQLLGPSGLSPGFLGDPVAVDHIVQTAPYAPKTIDGVPGVEVTLERAGSAEPDADRRRMRALLDALYQANGSTYNAVGKARAELAAAQRAVDDDQAKLDDLKRQADAQMTIVVSAPSVGDLANAQAKAQTARAAYVAAQNDLEAAQALVDKLKTVNVADPAAAAAAAGSPDALAAAAGGDGDPRLDVLNKQVAELTRKVTDAKTHANVQAADAGEALRRALNDFGQQVAAAGDLWKDDPQLQQYLDSARALQNDARDMTTTLLTRRADFERQLADFKRSLDDDLQQRREKAWADDGQLTDLVEQREIDEHKFNAAMDGGMTDPAELKTLQGKIEADRQAEDARRKAVAAGVDPHGEAIGSGLQAVIDSGRRQLEEDRKQIDRKLDELQQKFVAAAPSVEKLPAEQQALAARIRDQMEAVNAARRQYAAAAADPTSRPAGAADVSPDELALADAKARAEQVRKEIAAANEQKLDQQQRAALAAARESADRKLAAARDAVAAAKAAAAPAGEAAVVAAIRYDAARDARLKLDELNAKLTDTNNDLQVQIRNRDDKQQAADRAVEPLPPADDDLRVAADPDERPKYVAGSLGGIAALFLAATFWVSHRQHRRAVEEQGYVPRPSAGNAPATIDPLSVPSPAGFDGADEGLDFDPANAEDAEAEGTPRG